MFSKRFKAESRARTSVRVESSPWLRASACGRPCAAPRARGRAAPRGVHAGTHGFAPPGKPALRRSKKQMQVRAELPRYCNTHQGVTLSPRAKGRRLMTPEMLLAFRVALPSRTHWNLSERANRPVENEYKRPISFQDQKGMPMSES